MGPARGRATVAVVTVAVGVDRGLVAVELGLAMGLPLEVGRGGQGSATGRLRLALRSGLPLPEGMQAFSLWWEETRARRRPLSLVERARQHGQKPGVSNA